MENEQPGVVREGQPTPVKEEGQEVAVKSEDGQAEGKPQQVPEQPGREETPAAATAAPKKDPAEEEKEAAAAAARDRQMQRAEAIRSAGSSDLFPAQHLTSLGYVLLDITYLGSVRLTQ